MANTDITDVYKSVYDDGPTSDPSEPSKPRIRQEVAAKHQQVADDLRTQIDGLKTGIKPIVSLDLATTGNVTLSGEQTIDGTLTSAKAVLVTTNTDAKQNGPYRTAAGAWTRLSDFDTGAELFAQQFFIKGGTANGNKYFGLQNTTVPTVGVTNLVYEVTQQPNTAKPGALDALRANSVSITAGTTTDLSLSTGDRVPITGAATITSFGTVLAGAVRALVFDSAATITHNDTSLILPGKRNILTKPGDAFVFRSLGSGNWQYESIAPATILAPVEEAGVPDAYGEDLAGNTNAISKVSYDWANRVAKIDDIEFQWRADDTSGVGLEDSAGNVLVLNTTPMVTVEDGFTPEEYAYVEARAAAKRDLLNAVDVSGLASYVASSNLLYWLGQSYAAGDNPARLWASASYIALMGWQFNAWAISPEYRTKGTGSTYDYYPGGTGLFPLVENFITTTAIVSANDVAAGNYDTNARGGTPGPLAARIFAELRKKWLGLGADSADRYQVHMSSAKGGGSMTEIGTSPELDRALNGIEEYDDKVNAQSGSLEPALSGGKARNMSAMFLVQGQASDGGESNWPTLVNNYDAALQAKANTEFGQTAKAPMFLFQTGGRNYGSTLMYASSQAVDMMLDINPASANFNKTIASDMWDGPSPGRLPISAAFTGSISGTTLTVSAVTSGKITKGMLIEGVGVEPSTFITALGTGTGGTGTYTVPNHPTPVASSALTASNPDRGNWHPFMAYNGKLAIMAAVAAFFMLVRREYWWMPFPYEVFHKGGKRALLSIPCKFGKLREGLVTDGHVMRMLPNKGVSFATTANGTTYNPVKSAEIVEGFNYVVEIECDRPIADYPYFKLGDRNGQLDDQRCGLNNFRDSFNPGIDIVFPSGANLTVAANGFNETAYNNGLGHLAQDIAEWVGPDVDLSCRAMRHKLTVQTLPTV